MKPQKTVKSPKLVSVTTANEAKYVPDNTMKRALARIKNAIVEDGNSITLNMSIFELKAIVEMALESGE